MSQVFDIRWVLLLIAVCSAGCQKSETPEFRSSEQIAELPGALRAAVHLELQKRSGTFSDPRLIGNGDVPRSTLLLGQRMYQQYCVQCHGVSGDGNGPVAASMYPRPRDYRKGVFKFTSTPYGAKPLRSDLIRTVTRGVRGTSMPGFSQLQKEELEAVVDYVLALTRRGELEESLIRLADFEEAVDPQLVEEESIPQLLHPWRQAEGEQVVPLSTQPVFTLEHVRRGQVAFLTAGCSKCHGEDGRGQTPENLAGDLKDRWGHVTRAADLTSGMLRGGQLPIDVYRRIYSGINGTPMPGFANAFRDNPDTIWDLVAYVLSVSNRRRMGEIPHPGPIAPYVPVSTAASTGAE